MAHDISRLSIKLSSIKNGMWAGKKSIDSEFCRLRFRSFELGYIGFEIRSFGEFLCSKAFAILMCNDWTLEAIWTFNWTSQGMRSSMLGDWTST